VLKRIEFYPLRQGRMIAVLLMSTGLLQNRMLEVDRDLRPQELEGVHRYLNELCDGKELSEVRRLVQQELDKEQNRYDELVSSALRLGAQALAGPMEDEVLVEGRARLLDSSPELDPEELKDVLRALEEKRLVLSLLDETIKGEGVQVFIGAETGVEQAQNWSLVARAYGAEQPLGTLGVIGPLRMDYPSVMPLVDLTAEILSRHLGNG
jgi:heat-inducible transcriptional repressor